MPVHYLLGLNYYRMRDFPKSVEHLQRVMQLSPDYALASFQLGLAYARDGDFDHAIATLKRTLELDPEQFLRGLQPGSGLCAEADDDRSRGGVSFVGHNCA